MFGEINEFLTDFIWGSVLIYVLPVVGIFFTLGSRFVQFRYFGKMFGIFKEAVKRKDGHISSFQALMLSVAGRVGAGNIAGVAVAITLGGPGAVFWMWMLALLGMATSLFECSLGQFYKEKDVNDPKVYRGGPAYYATKALGQRWLGIIISILILITFGFAFNAAQSYFVTTAINSSFGFSTLSIALILTVIFAAIIFGGVKRITKVSEFIVPIMAFIYLALTIVIIVINLDKVPSLILMIFNEAFNPSSAIAGGIGAVIAQGAKRGMYSNEAGLGSAPNVAAVAHVTHPVQQGIVQSFSVFIDTIVLCSCTAFMILLSSVYVVGDSNPEGILLSQNALIDQIGAAGGYFITIALMLFCFSTMIYNYYLAENSLNFFSKGNIFVFNIFRILCVALLFWGAFQDLGSIFTFVDLSMGLLAICNIVVIVILFKPALKLIKDYDKQLKEGKTPVLNPDDYKEYNFDKELWQEVYTNSQKELNDNQK